MMEGQAKISTFIEAAERNSTLTVFPPNLHLSKEQRKICDCNNELCSLLSAFNPIVLSFSEAQPSQDETFLQLREIFYNRFALERTKLIAGIWSPYVYTPFWMSGPLLDSQEYERLSQLCNEKERSSLSQFRETEAKLIELCAGAPISREIDVRDWLLPRQTAAAVKGLVTMAIMYFLLVLYSTSLVAPDQTTTDKLIVSAILVALALFAVVSTKAVKLFWGLVLPFTAGAIVSVWLPDPLWSSIVAAVVLLVMTGSVLHWKNSTPVEVSGWMVAAEKRFSGRWLSRRLLANTLFTLILLGFLLRLIVIW